MSVICEGNDKKEVPALREPRDIAAYCGMEERMGFEPTNELPPLQHFQCCAFDHSATSPRQWAYRAIRPFCIFNYLFFLFDFLS